MNPEAQKALRDNLRTLTGLQAVASALRSIPTAAAEYYGNGGPGVGQAVVGDRFQGKGNARFVPLSHDYQLWKSGKSKALNAQQKIYMGRGSRFIKVQTSSKLFDTDQYRQISRAAKKRAKLGGDYNSWFNSLWNEAGRPRLHSGNTRVSRSLPILVLSGYLRAAVTSRGHAVTQVGDVAYVTFSELPKYALYHNDPKTAPFPKRSPVEPNADDMVRVAEFISRKVSVLTAKFNTGTVAFGDAQARFI